MTERIGLGPLKEDARSGYEPCHPYRLAVESLPDEVTASDFLAELRILLPLARVRGD
jgi:hypothetical protein